MPDFDGGTLEKWDPALFPYSEEGRSGTCRFAPTCGGVVYGKNPDGSDKTSRPDEKGCPNLPAEFAEATGMRERDAESGTGASAERRYLALCRPRAVRRFGAKAVRETEEGST